MYSSEVLLTKLNAEPTGEPLTLADLMSLSLTQLQALVKTRLTPAEAKALFEQAQQARKDNTVFESRLLARNNPQLTNMTRLDVEPLSETRSYTEMFASRADNYVTPGSVSSMFSPAAYLTELYREAMPLHPETSVYNLKKRRPDLGKLLLSQVNMDGEVSTLSLSNNILMDAIAAHQGWTPEKVMETLSTYRFSGDTPCHIPYNAIRQSILHRDPSLSMLTHSPYFSAKLNPQLLTALEMTVPPELLTILTEEVTEENAAALFEKNFGTTTIESLSSVKTLANYYNLPINEVAALISTISASSTYLNNNLNTITVNDDGIVDYYNISVEAGGNGSQLNYAYLIPLMGGAFEFNFSTTETHADASTLIIENSSYNPVYVYFSQENLVPQKNQNTRVSFTIPTSHLSDDLLPIHVKRKNPVGGGYYYAGSNFTVNTRSFKSALLLNKLIRLYKASSFSLPEMERVLLHTNSQVGLDTQTVTALAQAMFLSRQHGISPDDALVLSGMNIGMQSTESLASQFDQLFNTPPINGQTFIADGTVIEVHPDKLAPADSFRRAVLKRAWQVDDAGLYTMHQIGNRTSTTGLSNTLDTLSDLHRIALQAQVHSLSIDELNALLLLSPYSKTNLYGIDHVTLKALTQYLFFVTEWLGKQKWSVYQLFVMVTGTYSTIWTPSLDTLQQTLLNGLGDQPDLQGGELVTAMAPFIASSLKFNTSNLADSALRWANHIKPAEQTTDSFWALIQKTAPSDLERNNIIAFAQTLAQLSLIINSVNISEQELLLLVSNPALLNTESTSLGLDVDTLQQLTKFHDWINGTRGYVNDVLTALNAGSLDAALLAPAMEKNVSLVAQAMAQAAPGMTTLKTWSEVDRVLQWLNVADVLNLSPDGVADLMALDYDTTPYADWVSLADMLLGALDTQQRQAVDGKLSEAQSAALSAYYMREVSPVNLANRDALYSHLLIDNQVSAEVKTTRLAEAIASVQLYVHRTLSGQEADSDTAVSTRQFFVDWDTYNARYSTWAGVSQLVYYPENYVDPTMRVGQTRMMDGLLQDISQSALNVDTTEGAFKSYLTKFDEIANLNIISGFHDNLNFDHSKTYFVGASITGGGYYWRFLNQELRDYHGGYPVNAWSEWVKINTAINPLYGVVRPIIYNSRLNAVWVETIKKEEGKDYFELKIASINYDNSWAKPASYDITDIVSKLLSNDGEIGMYCSVLDDNNAIVVLFYTKKDSVTEYKDSAAYGCYIYQDTSFHSMETTESSSIKDICYNDFDTKSASRVIKRFVFGGYSLPSSVTQRDSFSWGRDSLTQVSPCAISKIYASNENIDSLTVHLDAKIQIRYDGLDGRQKEQTNMLKYGVFNTNATQVRIYKSRVISGRPIYTAMTYTPSGEKWACGTNCNNPSLASTITVTYQDGNSSATIKPNGAPYVSDSAVKYVLETRMKVTDSAGNSSESINDYYDIDTHINHADVRIEISAGSNSWTFNATEYVASLPSFNLTNMVYEFSNISFTVPSSAFVNNKATIYVKMRANSVEGRDLGSETFSFIINRVNSDAGNEVIEFTKTDRYAQYLQRDVHRVRINTLFAQQLIAKANAGVDKVLAMDTQLLPEPQVGNGGYINIFLPAYDAALHGATRDAAVRIDSKNYKLATFWRGQLQDTERRITLFVPLSRTEAPFYDIINFPGNLSDGLNVELYVNNKRLNAGNLKTASKEGKLLLTDYTPESTPSMTVSLLSDTTEPMDFNGANALYFWEMFYYTPMMVFTRLLQESQFDEALSWLKYIWSPAGYVVNGSKQPYNWNCRPLEEDTTWNADPLDSVDPDAVAQNDPMHYKVATFMRMLDLLMARGDTAYRRLERDTLNEAKMWYLQALNLLGDEPYVPLDGDWEQPSLETAAEKTAQSTYQQALLTLRETGVSVPLTANSLTALFLPEVNGKLQGYWQVLAQRLYNLRHNLSIDGQPLSLALYAPPASPEALHSTAVATSQGGGTLPPAVMPLYRFPVILDSARGLVGQLTQFGATLLSLIERQDSEAMAELLQTQARDLMVTTLALQDDAIAEVDADEAVLQAGREAVQRRLTTYAALYDENINIGEKQAMDLYLSASIIAASGDALRTTAATMDLVPNIYGLATGGMVFGAAFNAMAISTEVASQATRISADRISYSETYRRRREEWAQQRDSAEGELKQIEAQLVSLGIRREAAVLQKTYLETQQAQVQTQLEFLQRKFSNKALYNWLRGCLSDIYHQFYDLTVSRCLMSQEAYRWELNKPEASFIKPGAWNSTYAGLMAGENLMLNLTQMEDAYLKQDERPLEVTRTVSLAHLYAALKDGQDFVLADEVKNLLDSGSGQVGTDVNGLKLTGTTLASTVKLADLDIMVDYPDNLGSVRRIKQISVTLPMLMGPYQDVQAVLSYGGSVVMPRGCNSLAVSHGMNDSGQFQLDFNDARYLPFEGIPVNDTGTLTLSFPNATGKQETLLLSLSDIILHIRYTILH